MTNVAISITPAATEEIVPQRIITSPNNKHNLYMPTEDFDTFCNDWAVIRADERSVELKCLIDDIGKQGLSALATVLLHKYRDQLKGNLTTAMQIARGLLPHLKHLTGKQVYRPGTGRFVQTEQGLCHENLYANDGVNPVQGDISIFRQHLTYVCGGEDRADYLLDVLAMHYQAHWAGDFSKRPQVCFVIYSARQGIGKSKLATLLEKAFGKSAMQKAGSPAELQGTNGVNLWKRSVLIVEEAEGKEGGPLHRTIKAETGMDYQNKAVKFRDVEEHETLALLVMFSNPPPSFLPATNPCRRTNVFEADMGSMTDAEVDTWLSKLDNWVDNEGGAEAIAYHLLNRDHSANGLTYRTRNLRTQEFWACMRASSDEVTPAIMEELETLPEARLFHMDDFSNVWDMYHITDRNKRKEKLLAAGLKLHPDQKVKGARLKQATYWSRDGDVIVGGRGKEKYVSWRDPETNETYSLPAREVLAEKVFETKVEF